MSSTQQPQDYHQCEDCWSIDHLTGDPNCRARRRRLGTTEGDLEGMTVDSSPEDKDAMSQDLDQPAGMTMVATPAEIEGQKKIWAQIKGSGDSDVRSQRAQRYPEEQAWHEGYNATM
eukprot:1160855-Pyramimonas_sp.AAC.1